MKNLAILLILGTFSCTRSSPARPGPDSREPQEQTAQIPVEPSSDEVTMVISVVRNSPTHINALSEYCIQENPDAEALVHEGTTHRLAGVNVRFPGGTDLDMVDRAPALLVRMRKKADLSSILKKTDRICRPDPIVLQARSDWGTPECRQEVPCMRSMEQLKAFSFWDVVDVKPWQGLVMKAQKDNWEVTWSNPFAAALPEVKLIAWYEGGPGKPMPLQIEHDLASLPPGGTHTFLVPMVVDGEKQAIPVPERGRGRSVYWLHRLKMQAEFTDGQKKIPVLLDTLTIDPYKMSK